jgi:hypothetical protein
MTALDWATMQRKSLIALVSLAALLLAEASPAVAQTATPMEQGSPSGVLPTARPRIGVNPRPVYRRCTSWYVIQYRPSGTVLFPEKHCWWQRG